MTWALSSHYFPLAYACVGPALRVARHAHGGAALMAGGSYGQVFARVTLPLLRPAILSALLLLFVMGMASYEVPRLIGGRRASTSSRPTSRRDHRRAAGIRVASALSLTLLRFACSRSPSIAGPPGTRMPSPPSPARAISPPREARALALAGGARIGALFVCALGLPLFTLICSRSSAIWRSHSSRARVGDARQLRFHPELSDLSFGGEDERHPGGDGATIVAVRFRDGLDRATRAPRYGFILDALAFAPIAIPGVIVARDSRGLPHAADSDLQHHLDPAHRLRDLISALRHALCLERTQQIHREL